MNQYNERMRDLVASAERFAAAVRNAAIAANGVDSPEADAMAQLAVTQCRAALLEVLNDFPAMRLIYTVTPLSPR